HGEAKAINYDLSEYGSLYYANNYDDGTMLICSSKLEDVYIDPIYPNGSKISVNYENGINFKNTSSWNLIGCWPSVINYILLLYYNRSDPIINTTLRGTNLNIKGEITTNDNGVANPISSGSLKSPLKGYRFYSQVTFFKVDGQYAIVYIVTDLTKSFEIFDNMDESSEQMLLYQYYGSTLTNVFLTDCQAGFNSLGLQSNICFLTYLTLDAMEYIKFIQFSSSGSIIQEGFLSTRSNTSFQNTIIESVFFGILPHGGAIEFNYTYYNSSLYDFNSMLTLQFRSSLNTTSDYNILFQTINADIVSSGIFNNNTIWVAYGNGTIIDTVDNSKLTTIDMVIKNVAILSSYPTLNMTITLSYNSRIIITLYAPIITSTGNISIYQINNSNNLLLPQVYSASSHCEVYNITTLSCPILSSTFNRINSDYMIIVEDNFVRALSLNEPFYGIKQGVWQVKTPKYSTQAILRLNSDSSSYFSNYNKTQFDDLLQQIKETIPLMNDRLQITHNIQPDPLDFSKLLIEFSISKANYPLNDPKVYDVS
ncbi:18843_t:CDS:2, partial [Gigaspora margarita]